MRWLLGGLALLVSVSLAIAAWLFATEPGLLWMAARAQAATDGRLAIEGLQGALTRDIRISSLRYADDDLDVRLDALDFRLDLPPLLAGRAAIRSLKAESVHIALGAPGDDTAQAGALPLGLELNRADIGELKIERGGETYLVRGLEVDEAFARRTSAGASLVRIAELAVERGEDEYVARTIRMEGIRTDASGTRFDRADLASLSLQHGGTYSLVENLHVREASLGDAGRVSATLSADVRHERYQGRVQVKLGGTLERLQVGFEGMAEGIAVRGQATVAPAAEQPLQAVSIDAGPIDLSRLQDAWPRTALTASLAGKAQPGGRLRGTLSARNARPGTLDQQALPVSALEARFTTDFSAIAIEHFQASLGLGGRIAGSGDVRPARASFDVRVSSLDLSGLQSTLRSTALEGKLKIVHAGDTQSVQGTVQEMGMSLTADVVRSGDHVQIRSLRAAAEGGEASGSGTVHLGEPMKFDAQVELARFDPSRFGEYPRGDINGRMQATGTWGAEVRAHVRWRIQDSLLEDERFTSAGQARIDGDRLAQADAEARFASAQIIVRGALGRAGDEMAWQLKVPQIDDFVPELAGSLVAHGRLSGPWGAPQGTVVAQARELRLPNGLTIHHVAAKGGGTLERHTVDVSVKADDVDLEALLAGGWQDGAWVGELRALRNLGQYPLRLSAPAALRAAPQRVELDRLHATLGEGHLVVHALKWADGGLTSSGEFARLPAQWAILAAGLTEELRSTLFLDGQWSISTQPAITGSLSLQRAAGDLTLLGPAPLELGLRKATAEARFRNGQVMASADVALADGRVLVKELTWAEGKFASTGEFRALPAQWVIVAAGLSEELRSTLLLDGQWSLAATPRLTGALRLSRAAGDLTVVTDVPLELGLQKASVDATFKDGNLNATGEAVARFGTISFKGGLAPEEGAAGMGFTPRSRIALQARVNLVALRILTEPFITDARVDGRLSGEVRVNGTLEAPQLDGSVRGDALSFDVPPYGIFLKGGELRAVLEGDVLRITEFSIQGGEGRFVATGTLPLHAASVGPRVDWRAERFGVLERPDMRLTVSGKGSVNVIEGRVGLTGALRADRGYLELEQERLPRLGDDVVIVGETPPTADKSTALPVGLDLQLDLGDALQVRGYGLEGRLAGRLQIETSQEGELRVFGRIQTVNATFMAYGNRLQVDPGIAIFDGPIDNPALQMTAWRRNLPVEAGVQITGTAAAPRIQLVSQPPVPEGERLSWLVLGRAPSDATKADLGLLQAAAGALLARGDQVPFDRRLAQAFGLDEIALRGTGELADRVVAVGKRLSDRLYVSYEHGLGMTATALVKLDYALTQRLAVRAETGTTSGVGLFYRFSWD